MNSHPGCSTRQRRKGALKSQQGAFDLPSIIVGVVVVGILIVGVLAAIFGVIPFAQDKAAKQDLAAVRTAEGTAKATGDEGVYLDESGLTDGGFIEAKPHLAVETDPDGTCYVAVAASETGTIFYGTDRDTTADVLTGSTDTECLDPAATQELADSVQSSEAGGATPEAAVMDSTWDTSLPGCTTVTVPLKGTIDATIDWGDGTTETVATANPTHTYTDTPGEHSIRIVGTFTTWGLTSYVDWTPSCITEVTKWGETGTTDMFGAFATSTTIREVAEIPSTVTNTKMAFMGAPSFNGDLSGWDVSNVTNMRGMFRDATSFNQELSAWDVAGVNTMWGMFRGATSFNQNLNTWDVSGVTNMKDMFSGAIAFDGELSSWDTSSVEYMHGMFLNANSFNGDLSAWDTSNVLYMYGMFEGASSFNSDISGWDVGNVTELGTMFRDASSFNRDIGGWNVGSAVRMTGMFMGATSFDQNLNSWDTSKVIMMNEMFNGATTFNGNIGSWDTSAVESMHGMFSGATTFNANISGWDVGSVNGMDRMFQNADAFNQDLGSWNTSNVNRMVQTFEGADAFNQDISGWDVSSVENSWDFYNFAANSALEDQYIPERALLANS